MFAFAMCRTQIIYIFGLMQISSANISASNFDPYKKELGLLGEIGVI